MFKHKLSLPLTLLLAISILISTLGLSVGTAQAAACPQYHTVQRGEYLVQIARRYNTTWRALADLNNLKNPSVIYPGQRLCVSTASTIIPDTGSSDTNATTPRFDIRRVVKDDEVTFFAKNFPARARIDVLMDEMGTRAERGILAGTVTTDRNGEVEATVDIPRALWGESQIAIRLEAQASNHFAYSWFYNRTSTKPGINPVIPDLDDEDAMINRQRVQFQAAADIFQGNGGFFMPSSNWTAWASVLRFQPNASTAQRGLNFVADLLEVRMLDQTGKAFQQVFGINYVYFNLNRATRNAYEAGNLDIFWYDVKQRQWTPCEVQVLIDTKNLPHGRLSCVISDFGLYALARH